MRSSDINIAKRKSNNLDTNMNPETQKNDMSNGSVARAHEASSTMLDLVKNHEYIYVDTCSLHRGSFFAVYEKLKPILKVYGKKLIVPQSVMVELHRNDTCRFDWFVELLREEDSMLHLEIDTREYLSTFADHYIFSRFVEMGIHTRIALITQDGGLTKDLLSLASLTSIRGYKVEVYTLGKTGLELAPRANSETEAATESKPKCSLTKRRIQQIKDLIAKSGWDKKICQWTKKLSCLFS